ncbi:MAG: hypothetical protein JNL80_06950 [Phycisphaerae bacterium]|nr:hypothetical protein [Phycisphaerae bacterium]
MDEQAIASGQIAPHHADAILGAARGEFGGTPARGGSARGGSARDGSARDGGTIARKWSGIQRNGWNVSEKPLRQSPQGNTILHRIVFDGMAGLVAKPIPAISQPLVRHRVSCPTALRCTHDGSLVRTEAPPFRQGHARPDTE